MSSSGGTVDESRAHHYHSNSSSNSNNILHGNSSTTATSTGTNTNTTTTSNSTGNSYHHLRSATNKLRKLGAEAAETTTTNTTSNSGMRQPAHEASLDEAVRRSGGGRRKRPGPGITRIVAVEGATEHNSSASGAKKGRLQAEQSGGTATTNTTKEELSDSGLGDTAHETLEMEEEPVPTSHDPKLTSPAGANANTPTTTHSSSATATGNGGDGGQRTVTPSESSASEITTASTSSPTTASPPKKGAAASTSAKMGSGAGVVKDELKVGKLARLGGF